MTRHPIGLLVTLALGLLLAPRVTEAQPPTRVFRIGLLYASSPSPGTAEAFRQGLRDLGYVEGQNLVIEERRAERSEERLRALAAELVQLPVEVLVAQGGLYTLRAAKDATSTIPIVMVGASDPVGQGFVASLAQPGGNITGTSTLQADLDGKRLALLREAVPQAARIAVLVNPGLAEIQQRWVDTLIAASRSLGVELQVVEVRRADEFKGAFAAIQAAGARALLVMTDPLLFDRHVSDLTALAHRLPAIYPWRWFPEAGGLMSYAASLPELSRRAAYYVDQTWPRPPLPPWGVQPTHLNRFSGGPLQRAMLPKFSTDKIRIGAIMLKNFHISRPNGRLDRHRAQGCWAGYVDIFVRHEVH